MTARNIRKKRRKSALVQRGEYALFRLASFPLRQASDVTMDRWIDRFARWAPRLLKSRHELARRNLSRVFPEKSDAELEAILSSCWRHFASMSLRFVRQRHSSAGTVRVADRTLAEQLLARGRGLVVVTAHYGDWEAAVGVLAEFDLPITVVARALDNALLERDLYKARLHENVTLVDRRNAARSLVRTLEEKGMIVVLADQAVKPREGIKLPFLGRPAWTTPAPARLALRSEAPIVVVFCEPGPDGIRIDIAKVLEPSGTVEQLTAAINDAISDRIRLHPEWWLWMHDRWKHT